ncbi:MULTISPECIES: thiamine phosphate synthase [Thermoactinomyces]|jgi:thiamine-phosphate pyrophosphorylase|uniref:Thiamine-phosphate synthase n=1 Tax=Thermoactinomyces daqus TaxID=1329516 RepID=A0A7W1X7M8_9BACL|nr:MULTISPECIES: thiamine phosphate synthase [Thermoactinomyces]MBA4541537.1 thiamine phosphate synthase [Thermoactinomyces daqus]MBH8597533.1 thiamine phosphate synthase [Thermoactinomyces sp. CICC 10523]MBH8606593.1 thiamine phosphate synthase [Thermoactinomyces sp. CICC 10521]
MSFVKNSLSLYFIMGSQDCPHQDPVRVLEQAINGGITCFQYREKNSGLHMHQTVLLGKKLRRLCREHGIPFLVNDRVDLALILEADGVHIGQEDLPASEVRKIIGPDRILGVSAETPAEAEQAMLDGADYIGVGPMYSTLSKKDAGEPIGPDAIQQIRRQIGSDFPIVGIGGITPERTPQVMEAGADGVAVISAISKSGEPSEAARRFRQYLSGSTKL